MEIRQIEKTDNDAVKKVIRSVFEEFGINKPGTAYYDDSLNHMFESFLGDKKVYYVGLLDGKIMGGAGIFPTITPGHLRIGKNVLTTRCTGKGAWKSACK